LRRLFSTFACGWPGAGLLLMRLVAGTALIVQGFTRLRTEPPSAPAMLDVLAIAAGILLTAGLWTPLAGALVAIVGLWNAIAQPGDRSANILLGTMGGALALLGPGKWSVDARLFGWKRIDLRDRKS
jgi:putative oxidoreductase